MSCDALCIGYLIPEASSELRWAMGWWARGEGGCKTLGADAWRHEGDT